LHSELVDLQVTAIFPVPEMTVVPAELITCTNAVPVVIPKNEKVLKPGTKDCLPSVVLPLVTTALRPV